MQEKISSISLNFLKKENYTGSMQGMRYMLRKEGEKLEVTIWPEPFSYQATKQELKQSNEFEFSNEGKEQALDWVNKQYEQQKELWDSVNPYK